MPYLAGTAPYLRRRERRGHFSWNVCVALAPLFALSCFYYGEKSLWLAVSGVAGAVGAELVCDLLWRRGPWSLADGTAVVTGGIIAAVMSPLTPLWVPAAGAIFAICVVKIPFGGSGRSIFNPAAGGLAFLTVCFPEHLFRYPVFVRGQTLETMFEGQSPAATLAAGGSPKGLEPIEVLQGAFPGPIGGVAIGLLLACALYLLVRRTSSPLVMAGYFAACMVLALCFPRGASTSLRSLSSEFTAGYLVFGGVFMVGEPVTAPKHPLARVVYGVLAGVLVMSLRHFGRAEEGVCFAILLANLFASAIDRWCWNLAHWLRCVLPGAVQNALRARE